MLDYGVQHSGDLLAGPWIVGHGLKEFVGDRTAANESDSLTASTGGELMVKWGAQCQLPMIITQWRKNAFGVRKNPKQTVSATAIWN